MQPDHPNSSIEEIISWHQKSAILQTLHQQLQLPQVQIVKDRLRRASEQENVYSLASNEYEVKFKEFVKLHNDAKDNVKFLNTLERQFKNLSQDQLSKVEETLSSLMNGLQTIWIISRHYRAPGKMEDLLTKITNEICDKIEENIVISELFQLDSFPYETQLQKSIELINQGFKILSQWQQLWNQAKKKIEDDTSQIDRWDFSVQPIKQRVPHMKKVLEELVKIAETLKKFFVFLGPNLKAVTGNSEGIDNLVEQVKQLILPFQQNSKNTYFSQSNNRWKQDYSKFIKESEEISKKTIDLIGATFKDLRSSEGAFDLLQKFKNVQTLQQIADSLQNKYSDVLTRYSREVAKNLELFQKGKDEIERGNIYKIISKNKPPIAGSIYWSHSIFYRVKRPIMKFLQKEDTLEKIESTYIIFKQIKNDYKDLAKQIEEYSEKKYEKWSEGVTVKALDFLKDKILIKKSQNKYEINFSDEFKTLIKEAKHLEKMGKTISKTIINISLQEKEYYKYIDQLQIMLREYNESVNGLSEIKKNLLKKSIDMLNNKLEAGHESLNLSSLGIPDFIKSCNIAIGEFNDIKKKVEQNASYIEDFVLHIQECKILKKFDFNERKETKELMTAMDFKQYFDEHLNKNVQECIEKYDQIGKQFLKNIEENIEGSKGQATRNCPSMKLYYYYWERRVYNSILLMILRALLYFKNLINQPNNKTIPLFYITAEWDQPKISTNPNYMDLQAYLKMIVQQILHSAKQFARWKDGFCEFCDTVKGKNEEQVQQHTFFKDINAHPTIIKIVFEIDDIMNRAVNKARFFEEMWTDEEKQRLWNHKEKLQIEKWAEKNFTIVHLEMKMMYQKKLIAEFDEYPRFRNAYFIQEQFESVIQTFKAQAKEWLDKIGNVVKKLGLNELEQIKKEIEVFRDSLQMEPEDIEELKKMLNNISEIMNESMVMEFRIQEVSEKFRTLRMYGQVVDAEKFEEAETLGQRWNDLVQEAKKRDFKLADTKKQFSNVTQEEVRIFKQDLATLYQDYQNHGPSSDETNLSQGLDLLVKYQQVVQEKNTRKDELVLAEKLFNLPISTFKELVAIEEENCKLEVLYNIYRELRDKMKEWSQIRWVALYPEELQAGAQEFYKKGRAQGKHYEGDKVYIKLMKFITDFKESIPLIQKLKAPSVVDRHWNKLFKETGNKIDLNIKTMTLEQVFSLNLQNYEEKVNEIVMAANQEHSNEEELQKIEQVWKTQQFELWKQKKDIWVLKNTEDIRQIIEDQQANLQTVASSRYSGAFSKQINRWEKDLNRISETIDIWVQVQKKYTYLEGIFKDSEEIKTQLKEDSKKFDKNDKTYKKLMELTKQNSNIYTCCVQNDNRLMELKTLSEQLDQRQKSLSDYLDMKRDIFPRFYLLADDDLLSILGNSDLSNVQKHLLKLFDNCKYLLLNKAGKQCVGMESEETETYQFLEPQKPEGPVEMWMGNMDKEMQRTLHKKTKEAVFHYATEERVPWIKKNLGMISIVGTQIWWTWRVEDVFAKVKSGNKHAMKQEKQKQTVDLNDLIDLMRTDLSDVIRKKINTLIVVDVHARDIVSNFVRDSILNAKEFEWESQLRFYWVNEMNDISIQQCTGDFIYGYEYQGLNGRLVITPLTDRCVMTLTTALSFKLGGAPAGPAGTGKTETVKDLAKSLAIRCCVTNCGDNFDYKQMGFIFSGLVQTGFWGCFDEFNRITAEVLSIVAGQITEIQQALKMGKKKFELMRKELSLKPTVGIFVTMNPGYAGRTELPDNLKALFRPVTMVVPDTAIICEIMLMAEGFIEARILAKKMNVLYKLSREQLSKQYHYDFGLRALKSVLVMAGVFKRESQGDGSQEELTLMRALRDMNMPKFVFDDVPLFLGLISDLFPNMDIQRKPYEKQDKILQEMENLNLKTNKMDKQINKVVQLFETMFTRHTTMVVGPTGSGKSSVINILQRVENTTIYYINPKAITINELYGNMDMQTREWQDGLLSKTFKTANEPPQFTSKDKDQTIYNRWILFDGDVDAVWVENINSVMDDNKLLTLINGDRIRLENYCKLLFEVYDLQYASPATISRCGMVYVDPKDLGYDPYWEKWMKKWEKKDYGDKTQILIECLRENYEKYITVLIDLIFEGKEGDEIGQPLAFQQPVTNLNTIQQLCNLLDSMIDQEEPTQDMDTIEYIFIFAMIWSLGSCLSIDSRKKFEEVIKTSSSKVLPSTSSLFDNFYDYQDTHSYMSWEKKVTEYRPPSDGKFSKILVPTMDTVKFSWILDQQIKIGKPCIFVGYSGTAKSTVVLNYLSEMNPEQYMKLTMNFSSRTTASNVQSTIEDNIDKRSGRIFGPKNPGKKLVMFIDDLHMPTIDTYGTQQPIALMKFLIDKGYIYEKSGNMDKKILKDILYCGALLPPGGGTNSVDPRFISLFNCYTLMQPSNENLEKIYTSILKEHCKAFNEDIQGVVSKITVGTLKVFIQIIEQLPRTPVKFHYIFNLRDLSRIYEGLCRSTVEKFGTKEQFLRLWRNEVQRVFSDRLINNEDKQILDDIFTQALNDNFSEAKETVLENPLIIGDYMQASPGDDQVIDLKIYQECGSVEKVQTKFNALLEEYNYSDQGQEMNLVLFEDAILHLTKIHRIVRFPRGNALLIGYGGSGKQSLTRLSAYTAQYDLFGITLSRGYKEKEFREELKKLYEMLAAKPVTFLFTDSHVVEESFLELINNMLTIGQVPALFDEDGKKQMVELVRDECKKLGLPDTKDDLWNYFVEKVRDNLHIVLCMSPAGDALRKRCRNFPGLVSSTGIDWFYAWPREALVSVADSYLEEVEFEAGQRQKVTDHCVMVHMSVQDFSDQFWQQLKRLNYSTPKNYLDFLNNYKKMLAENKDKFIKMAERYEKGLQKLEAASEEVKKLQEDLKIKEVEVDAEKETVSNLLEQIQIKSASVSASQKKASVKKKELDVQTQDIAIQQAEAEDKFKRAVPILEAAKQELNNIKPSDISVLKSLPQPPPTLQLLTTMLCILKPLKVSGEDWAAAKSLLSQANFLQSLVNYGDRIDSVHDNQIKRVRAIIEDKENKTKLTDEGIRKVSMAALGMFKWVLNILEVYAINKEVTPLKNKAEALTKQLKQNKEELEATEIEVERLSREISELNADREIKQVALDRLTAEKNQMMNKLQIATKLITGLGREQVRWAADRVEILAKIHKLTGDCLTSSSFLSYAGPFDFFFRNSMVNETWRKDVMEKEIPYSEQFHLKDLLTSEVEISQWNSESLPSDELSIQNGILTTRASRWPLCIDPQMQAINWIKNREGKENGFKIMNINEGAGVFLKSLENSIKHGKPFLFENIDQELDPTIDPILEKNFINKAGILMIKLGDQEIEYNSQFRLYFTTKLANPKYTPEIMGKTMVINYTVTLQGLQEQLLNEVVGFERPDKEKQRKELIQSMSENKKKLKQAEDDLLQKLSESKKGILEDEELILTLEETKNNSVLIAQAIEEGKLTEEEIEIARNGYQSVAKRGAILFFAMSGLSSISEMYEFSLFAYLMVFHNALQEAKKDNILENRLRNIIDKLTSKVFTYTTRGLFQQHILIFSLQMTLMIQDGDGKIVPNEVEFFLKGNQSLDQIPDKPVRWISEIGWKDLQQIVKLNEQLGKLIEDLDQNEAKWKQWFDYEKPEDENLPGEFNSLTSFQRLLVLRVLRPDRVTKGVRRYITESHNNNPMYVVQPTLDLMNIFQQSSEKMPIIFILSPGADPLSNVRKLAETLNFTGNKFKALSLGQGTESEAQQYIETSSQRGHWLMLQNCHLLADWLKNHLEKMLEQMTKPSKDFRLWLTTQPTNRFPLGILQKSLKIVTEPPYDLKSNIKSTITSFTEEELNSCKHDAYKPLVWVVAFFHAVIQVRRGYGKIGWNVSYDFNDSDFKISQNLLNLYLKKAIQNKDESIPWASLKYLIGEAMYGGRVTDNYDRRVLTTYLDEYMGEFLFDKNRLFAFAKTDVFIYRVPEQLNYEGFTNFIHAPEFPTENFPVVFGLHPNAEITSNNAQAKLLWEKMLLLQKSGGGSSGGDNKEERTIALSQDILTKLPQEWDIPIMRREKQDKGEILSPSEVVLFQELERFNNLISKIRNTLINLLKAFKGEIGMSEELDSLSLALENGFLPEIWTKKLAPKTEKKLGSWMKHFQDRTKQYQNWCIQEPAVMWLSGLHIPESYLTALIQINCRAKGWALDKTTLFTLVTKHKNEDEIKKKPEFGCYVRGLYLEGAQWDIQNNCLQRQNPKELITMMPILQIMPIEANKLKLKDSLQTPVYVTQDRRNSMGEGLVFEANLRTQEHPSHWILQGVCMVLNVDF